jgi:hypothetical protein
MFRSASAISCLFLLAATATVAGPSSPDEKAGRGRWRFAVGLFAGGYMVDRKLDNYRWDTHPAGLRGVEATLLRGRFAAGARLWGSHTTQSSGIPGESEAPRVNLTGVEILGRVRVLQVSFVELWGSGHAGRLHLGYDPDRLTFDPGGLAEPVTVVYDPISEWEFGYGAQLRGEMTRQLALAIEAGRSSFALDTAHRRGDEIVQSREWFHGWSVQLSVSWLVTLG